MAAQQTGEPQKRFGIFLPWIGIVAFALALISVIAAGTFLLKRVWGDQTNTLSAILTILGELFSLIGLLFLRHPSRGSQAPASTKMPQINIYNYVNSPPTVSQQSSAPSEVDGADDKVCGLAKAGHESFVVTFAPVVGLRLNQESVVQLIKRVVEQKIEKNSCLSAWGIKLIMEVAENNLVGEAYLWKGQTR